MEFPEWQPPCVDKFISTETSNQLVHYFGDLYDWHGYIKFLSLAALRETSQDVPLEYLFTEPKLSEHYVTPDALDLSKKDFESRSLSEYLSMFPRLVLLGDPGSGKSTVVNWICTSLGRETSSQRLFSIEKPIVPLPLILRELPIDSSFANIVDVKERFFQLINYFLRRPVAKNLIDPRAASSPENSTPKTFFTFSLVPELLGTGQALLLLDGIDEIGDITIRRALKEAVQEGMRLFPRSRWLLTSRIVGYDEVEFDLALSRDLISSDACERQESVNSPAQILPDNVFHIRKGETRGKAFGNSNSSIDPSGDGNPGRRSPFSTHPETDSYLAKQLIAQRCYIVPFDDEQISHFTKLWWHHHESNPHLAGTKPDEFLSALKESRGAHSLARLPHLLTMIALIYRIKAELPDGRALLYNLIADAYLGTLDKERGLSHLRPIPYGVEEMTRWLSAIGWEMQKRRGNLTKSKKGKSGSKDILTSRSHLLRILKNSIRPKSDLDQNQKSKELIAELFLDYVGRRSGLLLPRGDDKYAFIHLSFQEYFAALHLREQVLDPDWWDSTNINSSNFASLADVRRYAIEPSWRETLIFLLESTSLISSKLPERLFSAIFDWERDPLKWKFEVPEVADVKPPFSQAPSSNVALAASVSVDPHIELSSGAREAGLSACWQHEIQQQEVAFEKENWTIFWGNHVAKLLLSRHSCREISLKALTSSLRKLQPSALNFRSCNIPDGFEGLRFLTKLKKLSLDNNGALTALPNIQSGLLKELYLRSCPNLSKFENLRQCRNLEILYLGQCKSIESVSFLRKMQNISFLELSGCNSIHDFSGFKHLNKIEALDLGFSEITNTDFLLNLRSLRQLNLSSCRRLKDISAISSLINLESLSLQNCDQLEDLSALDNLSSLASLNFDGCPSLVRLPSWPDSRFKSARIASRRFGGYIFYPSVKNRRRA